MFYLATLTLISLATAVSAVPTVSAIPTLYLVGDSTMAHGNTTTSIRGWGGFIPLYLSELNIVNKAIGGQSARSYTRDGHWADVQDLLKAGDYVIIEFGHNESGSPSTFATASVPGEGEKTQTVVLENGTVETVHTWPHYIKAMIDGAKSKGANPIISSQTPNNPYENSTTIINSPTVSVGYAQNVAAAKGVPYVNHFAATIQLYAKLGKKAVDSFYPAGHTHTNAAGANQAAYSFISGLLCPSAQHVLRDYISKDGRIAGPRC